MSEYAPRHEAAHSHEAEEQPPRTEEHRPRHERTAETAAEQLPSLEAARQHAEQEAHQIERPIARGEQRHPEPTPTFASRNLKKMAQVRLLKHAREQLPAPERAFSRIVHQPAIDAMSEVGSKTIARTSGLLTGSICAFLGSSIYLYITKHDGYRYNFLLSAMLFAGGFFLGLIIELIIRLAKLTRR